MSRPNEPDPVVELLDRARAAADAAGRTRRRSLGGQLAEGATFAGTLVDLAEADVAVTVRTVAGRTHRARVTAVGGDFALLRPSGGDDVLVRLGAIASVRAQPGARFGTAAGDRDAGGPRLLDVLAALAPDRPRVVVVVAGSADPLRGELSAVGLDVLTMRLEGEGALCSVRASAVTEVAVALGRLGA